METNLVKKIIERVKDENSFFEEALKEFVNSTEEELEAFLKRKITFKAPKETSCLISGDNILTIKALDGSRLICDARDTFRAGIDHNFINWGINKPGLTTPEITVQVHEIRESANFMEMFKSLPGIWGQKYLSQDQVIDFCENLSGWLKREGRNTFFLIKKR